MLSPADIVVGVRVVVGDSPPPTDSKFILPSLSLVIVTVLPLLPKFIPVLVFALPSGVVILWTIPAFVIAAIAVLAVAALVIPV